MNYKWFEIIEKDVRGYSFVLSSINGLGNVCIISNGIESWYHTEQLTPYTTMYYNEETNSTEFVSSYYTKNFETVHYNEAFLYSDRFKNYYNKVDKSSVLISQSINDAEYIDCKFVNGSVIEPKYKTLDVDGNEFIGTYDECYEKDKLVLDGTGYTNIEEVNEFN